MTEDDPPVNSLPTDRRPAIRTHAWRDVTPRDRVLGPLLSTWGQPPGIAMFHIGRSGSSVVARLLLEHPQVFWDGEAIRRGRMPEGLSPAEIAWHIRRRRRYAGRQYYGFETKPYHMRRAAMPLASYFDLLAESGFRHFIALERKNTLRKIVSNRVGRAKGSFSSHKHRRRVTQIRIDPKEVRMDGSVRSLRKWLEHFERTFRDLATLMESRHSLWLTYEEHVRDDPRIAYRQICDFVGLPAQETPVPLGRTNPFPLSEVIENYDEVARDLEGTRFSWMLSD